MTDRAGRCTAPQTPALRQAVGAYVLGALDQAETDQVTVHLADCASCTEEYLDLLDLVPLLATVTESDAVHGPVEPGPDVLGQTLAAWRRDTAIPHTSTANRRRAPRPSRRARYAMASGALVLFAGICAIGILPPAHNRSDTWDTRISWIATADAGAAADADDPDADGATATVQVSAATWGSAIKLTIEHVPKGYECTMIVVAADGHSETAGTWKAPTSGTITIPGTVGIDPDEIASIQVRLPDGATLLTLQRP